MAKITRATFLQFAINANAAADICEFGTPATGSPVYTTNVATLQAQAAWLTGWAAETVASNRPFLEDMNAVCYVFAYMLAYIFEMGIPEYDSGTTYFTNSIVQYTGLLWQSLVDSNLANTPATGSNWRQFTAPAPYIKVSEVQTQNTAGGPASTGSWITRVLNTKDTDTASIATLTSNQLTLPAGTYKVSISSPFVNTNTSQIRLYNITASAVLLTGTSISQNTSQSITTPSTIVGQITLASTTTVAIQYQVSNHTSNNDLGEPANFGSEVYTVAEFTKIS